MLKKKLILIIQTFKKFEESSIAEQEDEELILKDGKLTSRLIYLRKLINKRKVCGKKYNNVIEIVKEQLKDQNNKNAVYINNYSLYQMLPVIYNCANTK